MAEVVLQKPPLEMIYCYVNITLPDGRDTPSSTTVDLSSFIPSGKKIFAMSTPKLGKFILPYKSAGGETYITQINTNGTSVNITNTASVWTNYEFSIVAFVN